MIAPYWLYPVKVTNELTNLLKEKKAGGGKGDEEAEAGEGKNEIPKTFKAAPQYYNKNNFIVRGLNTKCLHFIDNVTYTHQSSWLFK